ncbi:hypothetical protein [Dethiosulfovibrio faecalis]|uniref:hypothetical protein n=1 Tax=Dethiosulfovibrio faecalis TaxID=2720018 RepID=UPI001F2E0AAB|nr:hypothetical protein [Dethiosulfovibrio faecalis]
MDLPRLLIADERREGTIPPGIVVAATLKSLGVPLRLFCGCMDESYIRMLSLGCDQEVFSIDPFQFRSEADLRLFFGTAARSDSLNLVLSPLGSMVSEDRMSLDRGTADLARMLDVGLVALPHANPVASLSSRIMKGVYEDLKDGEVEMYGVLFSSVLNPREYQLLEVELGRMVPSMSLGYIPRYMERRSLSLVELCSDPRVAQPIKTLGHQLKGMTGQIDWEPILAFGKRSMDMSVPDRRIEPVAGSPLVAVITDHSTSLGVDNDLLFFRTIGCRVEQVPLLQGAIPPDAAVVYVPHGLPQVAMKRLQLNEKLYNQIKSMPARRAFALINGGLSALWGRWYALSSEPRDRMPGFNVMESEGFVLGPRFKGTGVPVEMVPFEGGGTKVLPLDEGDKLKGFLPDYMKSALGVPGRGMCGWSVKDLVEKEPLGEAGWKIGEVVGSHARVELWSCPEVIKRWIRQVGR